MIERDKLVDDAMDALFDWCHKEKPGPITTARIFAMGFLHGEVLRLRKLLGVSTAKGKRGE